MRVLIAHPTTVSDNKDEAVAKKWRNSSSVPSSDIKEPRTSKDLFNRSKNNIEEVEESTTAEETPFSNGQKRSCSNNSTREMTWSNSKNDIEQEEGEEEITAEALQIVQPSVTKDNQSVAKSSIICPSCGHTIKLQDQKWLHDLPGLPAGVKFDPSDQEILEHLAAKVLYDTGKLHPLIDEFIPTIEGENGICYTHPEKLPGVSKDGQVRHFFHRPSKAYTTGTRKRRKVHTDSDGSETRWHKTGKTRPVTSTSGNLVKGYKKILVLYTNYGRQRKPEKTNWVMHQYHLGDNEEEKDGELVVSKVFYQTQPRQCGGSSAVKKSFSDQTSAGVDQNPAGNSFMIKNPNSFVEYYTNNNKNINNNPHQGFISYNVGGQSHVINRDSPTALIPNLVLHSADGSSLIHLPSNASKGK